MLLTSHYLIIFETYLSESECSNRVAAAKQFPCDGKECVAKPCRVVRIPKEGMVGVGAHHGGQARIGNIGKSKV